MSSSKGSAIVTGCAQGIGHAIALRLADDGFDVALNDIPSKETLLQELMNEICAKGRKCIVTMGDISLEPNVEKMISEVVDQLGGLDVMVANAGIELTVPLIETTVEQWDQVFAVNTRGIFLCYKHAGKQMIAQKRGGRIIGACSVDGKQGSPLGGAYSSSKFAVRGLTQCAAREFGAHGITANTYAPGAVNTPMLAGVDKYYSKLENLEEGQWIESQCCMPTALKRIGKPTDIASVVSFLASKDAEFITGQSITVDGGMIFD